MRLDFCVACGRRDGLDHHHLVPKSVGGSDEDTNRITLCHECHGKLHGVEWSINHAALTRAGQDRARAKGTHFGPKFKLDAGQRRKIAERKIAGESLTELARDYGVGEATIWRVLRA